ncbi:radical SAM protein [Streptomyces sp. NPDC000351]|uniref:radical SAM protein n=1 Tax=Streptomyces sp. NPDC000351 TaxID=3154250 RepID=UPI003318AD1A
MRTALPLLSVQRTWEPVIDQHETWLAINPVQGCNKGCSYCYLLDRGQTRVKPTELATPGRTVDLLLASPYYHRRAALALYTCTDALSTLRTRAHLVGLLRELASREVHNPVCLITKCAVTDDVIDAILAAQAAGIRVIVYLSYSGLGPDVEHGIDHDALRANFPRLHERGIPLVHYWRPLTPANAAPATITHVLDWAARYSACSVAVGLKVKPGARKQMTELWPALAAEDLPVESADAVWPRQTWDLLDSLPARYPGHPIFQTNSCALAYVLHRPDGHRVHGTSACAANHCPDNQRGLCAAATPTQVTTNDIRRRLVWVGVPTVRSVDWDAQQRTATVQEVLHLRDRNNVSERLGIAIRAARASNDRYWSGRLEGRQPLIVDP